MSKDNKKNEQEKKQKEILKDKLEKQEVIVDKHTGKFIHKG